MADNDSVPAPDVPGPEQSRNQPTVFGIPAPEGGLYPLWWRAYRAMRVIRHRLGLHDLRPRSGALYCDWCGKITGGAS